MKTHPLVLAAPFLILCLCSTSVHSADDSWKLPEGYYVPARFPMYVVHPRNGEVADRAYSKNAHPGVRWETPIIKRRFHWAGARLSRLDPGDCVHEKNILGTGLMPRAEAIKNIDNVGGRTFFDSDMKLIVKERKDNLGVRGAEIAVPVE